MTEPNNVFFCLTCSGVGAHYPSCRFPLPWTPGSDNFGRGYREEHEYELAAALGIRGAVPEWEDLLAKVRLHAAAVFANQAARLLPKKRKKVAARKVSRRSL